MTSRHSVVKQAICYSLVVLAAFASVLSCGAPRPSVRMTTAHETILPIIIAPWPVQLEKRRFEHVVVASHKAAFACAERLEQLTRENESASRTSRGFTLAAALTAAGFGAGAASMQFVSDESTKLDATTALAVGGSLATAVLSSVAAFTHAESLSTSTGKRIGEIQGAVRKFARSWGRHVAEIQPSRDGGVPICSVEVSDAGTPPVERETSQRTKPPATAVDAGTSADDDSGRKIIYALLQVQDGGVTLDWNDADRSVYFGDVLNVPPACKLPEPEQAKLYASLVSEIDELLQTCVAREDSVGDER